MQSQAQSLEADRHYLRLLHLAATISEEEVTLALSLLLEAGETPHWEAVQELVSPTALLVGAVKLVQSKLPVGKTFDGFEFGQYSPLLGSQLERLCSGQFVLEATNVVAVVPPGVGKSHAVAAIGYELIRQGKRVLWSSTAELVQRLLLAKRELRVVSELE